MSNASNILPLIVGAINDRETVVTAKLKCPETDDSGDPLSSLDIDVLFPKNDANVVPLVGGAVVKIKLGGAVIGSELYNDYETTIVSSFEGRISIIKKFIENLGAGPNEFTRTASEQLDMHVAINKFLETAPFVQRKLHKYNAPTLRLSNVLTRDDSASKINAEIRKRKSSGSRLSLMAEVGSMKFIPIEIIKKIYTEIAEISGDPGDNFGENVGLSGKTFNETLGDIDHLIASEKPSGEKIDEKICEAILNIFPIFRVEERLLEGDRSQKNIGFYTIIGDSIYVKMPDLSGRDSSGSSSNLYDIGEDPEFNYGYVFELFLKGQYNACAFDYQSPPAIEVSDNEMSKSADPDSLKIEIDNEGFYDGKTSFFLSPIIKSSSLEAVGMPGVKSIQDANEAFSVPNLSVPFFNPRESGRLPVIEESPSTAFQFASILMLFSKTKENAISFEEGQEGEPGSISIPPLITGDPLSLSSESLGVQIFGSGPGVDSPSDLLGLMNRPDMVLGNRDGDDAIRRNDKRYFSEKIYAAKGLMSSITPSIISDEELQIPGMFVKSISNNDGIIEFKERTDSSSLGLDFFYNQISGEEYVEFALYAVDDLGQIVRAPGQNIRLLPVQSSAQGASDNGFAGSGIVLLPDTRIIQLVLNIDTQVETSSIKVYDRSAGEVEPIATLDPGSYSYRFQGVTLVLTFNDPDTTWRSIIGSNLGTVYLEVDGVDGRFPYYISDEEEEPPEEPVLPINFKKEDRLSAKKFFGPIHSIPVIMDQVNNAKITLKYFKRVFKEGAEAYAYYAFHDNEVNRDILSDIGWIDEDIKPVTLDGGDYLIFSGGAFKEACKLGGTNFKRINNKKVELKFPGPFLGRNISRMPSIIGEGDNFAGYIVITNTSLGDNPSDIIKSGEGFNGKFTKIPLGPRPALRDSQYKTAFVDPPHIVALAAKLSSNSNSFATNSSVLSDFKQDLRGINVNNMTDPGPIIAADSLTRLSIIFKGPHSERRKGKSYNAYIGSKKLKQFRTTTVRRASEENYLVLNYKNIESINDSGWTDIVIKKKDKRFDVNYDSTFWSGLTVNLDAETPQDEGDLSAKDYFLNESEDGSLTFKENKRLFSPDDLPTYKSSESLFPGVGSPQSGLPYDTKVAVTSSGILEEGDLVPLKDSFVRFLNPIKLIPSIGMVLGADIDGESYGVVLTDTDVSSNPYGEMAELSSSGRMEVFPSLSDLEDMKDSIGQKVAETKEALGSEAESLQAEADAAREAGNDALADEKEAEKSEKEVQIQELTEAEEQLNDSFDAAVEADGAAKEAQEAADAAQAQEAEQAAAEQASAAAEQEAADQAAGASGGGDDEGALDSVAEGAEAAAAAAQAAADAVNDALAAVEAALALAQALLDSLSRLAMLANDALEDLESELSSYGVRDNDILATNIANIFINKTSSISGILESSSNPKLAKLPIYAKFEQNAAIKFNVPEIISIQKDNPGSGSPVYFPTGSPNFSDLEVASGTELFLKTVGTNEDTKVEINKIRVSQTISAENGIFKTLNVRISDLKKYTLLDNCIELALTNDNENRLRLGRQLGNDISINLEKKWPQNLFGGKRNKQGPASELRGKVKDNYLRFTSVMLDGVGAAKEFMQSFCDLSFHLTAELSLQLRNFKVLLIPIKVILCIIDVICALLHPIRLAFAIVRLFLCLYDLILLLPQLSVPAMLLALLLHIIELLLCVIIKVLSIVNAINEIINAFEVAIEDKDYPAIVALEETINEHLFSLEADLSVLEPILEILALFLELLQLVFAFPCQIGAEEDEDACIDPSQLAGLIISKVAPNGRIEPDALLPLAQTYTKLTLEDVGTKGNTPESSVDNGSYVSDSGGDDVGSRVLMETRESAGKTIVNNNSSFGGRDLTGLTNSQTGEAIQIEDGGFFSGDTTGDGQLDNVNYQTLRMGDDANDEELGDDSEFNATFGISFTKTKKEFSVLTGPDPRMVKAQFSERGLTNSLAFNWFLAIFFKKKNIDNLQTLDAPPGWVVPDGNSLKVNSGSGGFTSPVDGASDIDSDGNFKGFFLNKSGSTYQPKPLTVTLQLKEPVLNQETAEYEERFYEVIKTFGSIPSVAFVDDEFNVYFVQPSSEGGGIKTITDGGVEVIESINLKMINFPSAPKKKFSKESREVYRPSSEIKPKSDRAKDIAGSGLSLSHINEDDSSTVVSVNQKESSGAYEDSNLGKIMVYEQANANWLAGELNEDAHSSYFSEGEFKTKTFNANFEGFTGGYVYAKLVLEGEVVASINPNDSDGPGPSGQAPFPEYGIHDWAEGSKKEQSDFGEALDDIKVFDFPQLYAVDMRHLANEIAAACSASGPLDLLMDSPNMGANAEEEIGDLCNRTAECVNAFKGMFLSEELDESGVPMGIVPKMRFQLAQGSVPDKISQEDIVSKYEDFRSCLEGVVQDTCVFVLNPLNTSFLILGDEDETPLTEFVNPEQEDLSGVVNIVEELELDDDLVGLPKITGAMEYASGIGDSAAVKADEKAIVKIIPRDCYDEPLPATLDLTDSIKIEFIKDDTDGAELVPPGSGDEIFVKNGTEYTFGVTSKTPGKVQIRATVCSVVIQAVTDRGIQREEDSSVEVDCVDDITEPTESEDFAPGQLMKVDRVLSIIFTKNNKSSGNYGDSDRDNNERSAIPNGQTFGTNLEN